ncbi:MAG: ABC transporter ATP-binding protein [Candidatus Magasanikbacteria bacterium]
MKYKTKLTFKIFWQHARKYWLALSTIIISIIIGDVFSILAPLYYKKFFDELAGSGDLSVLSRLLWIIFGIALVHWFFIRAAAFANSYFQTSVMRDLANSCFAYLHKHSFSFFNNNFVGSLVKRVNRFYSAFEGVADRLTWDLMPIILNIVLITIVLTTRSIWLGLVVVVWVLIFCITNYYFSKFKLKYDVQRSEMDSKVTGVLADTITNHSNLKLFVGYSREKKAFAKLVKELNDLRRYTWDLGSIFDSIQWFLMLVLEISLMFIALKLWKNGILTIGDFVLIQAYLIRIFEKLWGFGRVIRHFYEHLADAEEMTEIFGTPHDIRDVKKARELVVKKGKIQFQSLNFNYHKTRRVVDKLNLTIKAGERIALVGPSGAGKSTVVKLLLRQHDVTSGKIFIDGQQVSKVTQESLWKNMSLVPQDPLLFHRSLIENIRYGKPDATDEEVVVAAKKAHCHEFIEQLQDGYQTFVGERGIKLSGGERQRVAIARAILRNAPILILDEATSSLDSESERLIQEALDVLMQKKTVIVVAHRLSTIMSMDRILVIDEGKILEQGSHSELIKKKNGLYAKLWDVQVGGFLK